MASLKLVKIPNNCYSYQETVSRRNSRESMLESGACSEMQHAQKWSMLRNEACSKVEHAPK